MVLAAFISWEILRDMYSHARFLGSAYRGRHASCRFSWLDVERLRLCPMCRRLSACFGEVSETIFSVFDGLSQKWKAIDGRNEGWEVRQGDSFSMWTAD